MKELKLLSHLKNASKLMDNVDEFKNEIAIQEIREYLKIIKFKSLWFDYFKESEEDKQCMKKK